MRRKSFFFFFTRRRKKSKQSSHISRKKQKTQLNSKKNINSPGKGFGPYGSCQGDAFPYRACSLKAMPQGKHATTASGPHQPWVSGVIREEK